MKLHKLTSLAAASFLVLLGGCSGSPDQTSESDEGAMVQADPGLANALDAFANAAGVMTTKGAEVRAIRSEKKIRSIVQTIRESAGPRAVCNETEPKQVRFVDGDAKTLGTIELTCGDGTLYRGDDEWTIALDARVLADQMTSAPNFADKSPLFSALETVDLKTQKTVTTARPQASDLVTALRLDQTPTAATGPGSANADLEIRFRSKGQVVQTVRVTLGSDPQNATAIVTPIDPMAPQQAPTYSRVIIDATPFLAKVK